MIFCHTVAGCMLFQILDKKSGKISMALTYQVFFTSSSCWQVEGAPHLRYVVKNFHFDHFFVNCRWGWPIGLRRGWNFHKNANFSLSSSSPNINIAKGTPAKELSSFAFVSVSNQSTIQSSTWLGVVLFGWSSSSGSWNHSQSESHYSSLNKRSESLTRINNYRSWVR